MKIVIIAGPNGAGKTTFAREYLPREADCVDFINADLIAAGLSPFQPEIAAFRAGRLMLEEIAKRVAQHKSFAFETTLSGRAYARDILAWQGLGYHVKLIFLSLPQVEMAIARVASRVAQGGLTSLKMSFGGDLLQGSRILRKYIGLWLMTGSIMTTQELHQN